MLLLGTCSRRDCGVVLLYTDRRDFCVARQSERAQAGSVFPYGNTARLVFGHGLLAFDELFLFLLELRVRKLAGFGRILVQNVTPVGMARPHAGPLMRLMWNA